MPQGPVRTNRTSFPRVPAVAGPPAWQRADDRARRQLTTIFINDGGCSMHNSIPYVLLGTRTTRFLHLRQHVSLKSS